jgi:hypothetical protein
VIAALQQRATTSASEYAHFRSFGQHDAVAAAVDYWRRYLASDRASEWAARAAPGTE